LFEGANDFTVVFRTTGFLTSMYVTRYLFNDYSVYSAANARSYLSQYKMYASFSSGQATAAEYWQLVANR